MYGLWRKCEKQLWIEKRSKPPSVSRTATLLMWCCRRVAVVSKCRRTTTTSFRARAADTRPHREKALREEVRLPGVEDWDTRKAMVSLVCHIFPLCGPCDAIPCERLPRSQQVRKTSRVNEAMKVRKSRKPFSLEFSVFVDTGSGVWFVALRCLSRSRRLSFSCSGVVLGALALERFPVRNG